MSPISSDEEYISDDSDDNIDEDEVENSASSGTPTNSSGCASTNSSGCASTLTQHKLCGDNIDKTVRQRYMRSDRHGTSSLHYFHSYAIADRIDFSNLSEESKYSTSLDNHALASMLLPSLEDEESLRKNFKVIVSRILYDNIHFIKYTFDGVVNWHIKHCYYNEMSKKSVTVSPYFGIKVMCMILWCSIL